MSAILKFIRENHILALIEQAIAKKKSRLSLNAFEIGEIPSLLYSCLEVEHLYLHRNKICTLPVQITQLVHLTTLTLDYNNISSLPVEIGNLKNLVNLNISYNPLKVLIPEIGELENLEAFWCNRIGLREIPKEIGKLTKLDTFGARGNELKSLPQELTSLTKLRWLTLENNEIEILPDSMDKMEGLVHCNLRHNRLTQFPESMLKCVELMYLQLNHNQISTLPADIDTSQLAVLEMIDLRENPICQMSHPDHPLIRYQEEMPTTEGPLPDLSTPRGGGPQLVVNATPVHPRPDDAPADPLVLGAANNRRPFAGVVNATPVHPRPNDAPADPLALEIDLESSSMESSEDWENSVNSSELDVQYQSDEERIENEAVGMVLPELSKYASTAS